MFVLKAEAEAAALAGFGRPLFLPALTIFLVGVGEWMGCAIRVFCGIWRSRAWFRGCNEREVFGPSVVRTYVRTCTHLTLKRRKGPLLSLLTQANSKERCAHKTPKTEEIRQIINQINSILCLRSRVLALQ